MVSNRLMNQMRCCAVDKGRISGRGRATNALRAPDPICFATRVARPTTVDASNSARTGIWVSSAAPIRETTWVATRELPPSSKKSSSRPTLSTPRTSPNAADTARSAGVRGSRKVRVLLNTGCGSALRSSLPLVLSGSSSSTISDAGTMYDGNARSA